MIRSVLCSGRYRERRLRDRRPRRGLQVHFPGSVRQRLEYAGLSILVVSCLSAKDLGLLRNGKRFSTLLSLVYVEVYVVLWEKARGPIAVHSFQHLRKARPVWVRRPLQERQRALGRPELERWGQVRCSPEQRCPPSLRVELEYRVWRTAGLRAFWRLLHHPGITKRSPKTLLDIFGRYIEGYMKLFLHYIECLNHCLTLYIVSKSVIYPFM